MIAKKVMLKQSIKKQLNELRYRLLLVDDEQNVLRALKRLLRDTNYEIFTATNGEEGLELFIKHEIQLVISDYRMPGMNGVDFLSRIRRKAPDTIRIILSGYADASVMMEAINDGQIYKFIPKPWNDHDLLTTIISAFEKYRLQNENTRLYYELSKKYEELTELNKTLEAKVTERTRDLETKNRALVVAQTILNYLPAGVIGIDNMGMIVYMNGAVGNFLASPNIQLGANAESVLDEILYEFLHNSLISGETMSGIFNDKAEFRLICRPLPDGVGVIGVFSLSEFPDCSKSKITGIEKAGIHG